MGSGQYTLAELVLTDGTNLVDLLYHFKLAGWQPGAAVYKGGGIFQDSPIADGRRMVQRYYQNIEEQFQLIVKAGQVNSAIRDMNRLREMFEAAADYWTSDWNDTMVWMEARGVGETNRRYALVVKGDAPNEPNPYSSPFAGPFGTVGVMQVTVEHLLWSDSKPTAWNETAISSMLDFNSGYIVGNVDELGVRDPVTDGTDFVGNASPFYPDDGVGISTGTHITHVFSDSFAAPTNLVNNSAVSISGSVPTTLFNHLLTNQALYFGSTVGVFSNVIIDLSQALDARATCNTWEYWNGAAWVALSSVTDKTSGLKSLGIRQVSWALPSNWATKAETVGGGAVTAYWVRVRITVQVIDTDVPIFPIQDARVFYTVAWPWIEVQASEVAGTIPALARIIMENYASASAIDRALIGLRSVSRGEDFSNIIAMRAGSGVGGGLSAAYDVDISSSADLAFAAVTTNPSMRRIVYTPTVAGSVTIKVDFNVYADQWLGRFRTLLRTYQTTSVVGYFRAEIKTMTDGVEVATTGITTLNNITDDYAVSGTGTLDTKGQNSGYISSSLYIDIEITASQGAVDDGAVLYIYDLILMPADEFICDILIDETLDYTTIVADGLASKYFFRVYANDNGTILNIDEAVIGQGISPGPPILQKKARQRLYFLLINTTSDRPVSLPSAMVAVKVQHQSRYHGMRGNE